MLPDVNLFASGIYRGKPWPASVVRAIDRNAKSLRKMHQPPAVLGHEEEQEFLDRTDLPNAGIVDLDTVRAVPDPEYPGEVLLKGNVVNVPPEIADLIEKGQYTHGSSEIYENFLDDFENRHGPAMRRFVFLGGTPPQVKRLGRLPKPVPMQALKQFAETKLAAGGLYLAFADLQPMDQEPLKREDMVAAIQEAMPGLSTALLDTLSDDQVKEILAAVPKPPEPTPAPAPAPSPSGVVPMDETAAAPVDAMMPVGPSREEMIAALVAQGQDQMALEAMPDAELKALYDQIMAAPSEAPVESPVAMMSEEDRKKLPEPMQKFIAFSEKQQARQAAIAKQQAAREREIKRKKIHAFCDQQITAGKLLPAQRDDYVAMLLPLDDFHAVHKFSDNGRVETLTALDRKMRELGKRPSIIRFGEKVPGKPLGPQGDKAEALAKAEAHAATVPETAWKQTDFKTARGFVEKFAEVYDKSPEKAMKLLPRESMNLS